MPPAPQPQNHEPIDAVAARLGASAGWVSRWLPHLPGAQAGQDGWKVGPAAAALLAELKRLDAEGRGEASMRRIVGIEPKAGRIVGFPTAALQSPTEGPAPEGPAPQALSALPPSAPEGLTRPSVPQDQGMQVRLVEAAMAAQSRMAMELARLAHTSGRWQGQLQVMAGQLGHTQAALRAAQQRVAELEASGTSLGDPHLKERLVAAGQVLAKMQADLAAERQARERSELALRESQAQLRQAQAAAQALAEQAQKAGLEAPSLDARLPAPDAEEVEALRQELAKTRARLTELELQGGEQGKPWWNFWE